MYPPIVRLFPTIPVPNYAIRRSLAGARTEQRNGCSRLEYNNISVNISSVVKVSENGTLLLYCLTNTNGVGEGELITITNESKKTTHSRRDVRMGNVERRLNESRVFALMS